MPIPLGVALGAQIGGSVLGGLLGSRGAKRAARERAQAYSDASNIVGSAYDTASGRLDPRFQQEQSAMRGVNALLGLGGEAPDYSLFRNSPGYQYSLDEGQRAIERSAAARGGLASGNTLLELQRHAQGQADQGFQNYLYNLTGLQSQGADAALGNLDVNRGNALADLRLGAGGARASGIEGSAAAWTGALGGVANAFGGFKPRNALRPQASSAYGGVPSYGVRMG